ncbi:O-antigen ligase family protein [Ruminiclostridium cellobioparum]|uniref:O-antigen ligase family protein n=1 Tax=Ruminiclostridium cellobioparum TaxID=29355 RepID=UPI000483FC37|nr:O-antigen ligase family protein [Ruminiclostridium cellobioparum]
MKDKVQIVVNILIIIFMPFMMYINISKFKINVAASDILLVLVGILFLVNIKDFFIQKRWTYILYFAGLVLSLLLSQYISKFNVAFFHVENSVMLIEIVKTIVVAIYFFTAFTFIRNERDYKLYLVVMSLSSIPVMIVGIISYTYFLMSKDFFIDTYKLEILRFMGTFEDPNLCALFFSVIFFVSLLNFKIIKNIFLRYLMLGIGILSFIIIILTMSRGGWLALAGTILTYILFHIRNIKKESVLIVLSAIIMVFISINLDYYFQNGEITKDMISRVQESLNKNAADVDRIQLMKAAFEMGNDNFLVGVGKGSFPLNSYKYLPENSTQTIKSSIPHNTILGFYSQQGILGVFIFILLPGYILYTMIKSKRKQNLFLIPVFVGIYIHSMTINIENTRFIWYILGSVLASEKMNIHLVFKPAAKMSKRTFITVLIALLLIGMFSYVDVSRKMATNIFTYKGATYDRKLYVVKPGDYQLTFDIYTDNHLNFVEIYDGDELLKKMEFKSAFGVVKVPIHLDGKCQVVFRSNEEGWMKINNAYFIQGNKKVPLYNYVLLPGFVEEWLNNKDLLVYSDTASFKEKIVVEDNKFSAVEILSAEITKYSNLTHTFMYMMESRQEIKTNYQFDMLLDYKSISYLQPEEYQRNLWLHRFILSPYTSKWEIGKQYTEKTIKLLTSEDFNLYGRYRDYENDKYSQESYFPIHYDLLKKNHEIIGLGESQWINVCYGKDKEDNINMAYNGWVESGRMNLQSGDYNITIKAQGSFLEEYSKVRIRDSELNEVAEITLDGNMKEYTVKYHVNEYKQGVSFILELINYKAEKDKGNRQVLLKDWLKVN